MEKEQIVYRGKPSQIVNIRVFITSGFLFLCAVFSKVIWAHFLAGDFDSFKYIYTIASKILFFMPIIWSGFVWFELNSHVYQVTSERIIEIHGILSRTTNELELFRVKDVTFSEPIFLRLFGCGNIILDTSDKSSPVLVLHAIKNARPVMELIRKNVGIMRTKKGVREMDV